ncbi:hypothetical protein B0T13DRAFT_21652 [Neurospora crassa]|nr:hypothetical protein B0T13DRAFT_21652 [Neurospora crassa]
MQMTCCQHLTCFRYLKLLFCCYIFLCGLCGLCLNGMVRRIWKLRIIYVWVEAGPSELGAMTPTSDGGNGAAADTPMRWEMDPLARARSRPALNTQKHCGSQKKQKKEIPETEMIRKAPVVRRADSLRTKRTAHKPQNTHERTYVVEFNRGKRVGEGRRRT